MSGSVDRVLTRYEQKIKRLEGELAAIRELVNKQAEDEGLWFVAATGPEAYLQQELSKLHAVIEAKDKT
jgi:hypothetical protein